MTDRAPSSIDRATARRLAVRAAFLDGQRLPATKDGILEVARHFGGIQIDPTRTVERTQYLVLWSRLGNYDRALLDQLLAERKLFEWNAFIVPVERLPELIHYGKHWPGVGGEWRERANRFMAGNTEFRQSILDQLRAEGPLQSRQIDDSKVKVGWESTGWTHAKNTSQMLEFMSVKMDVAVAGRVGQERLWDLTERVIPAETPRHELTEDEYQELRVMRAVARFGVGAFKEIRDRAYGLSIPAAKALLGRLVEESRLTSVTLRLRSGDLPGFADPAALEQSSAKCNLTTLVSPFDPLVYNRERTERLFDFSYKLEMYVPKGERKFGHFVLPIVHGDQLVGRLDSARDRKTNELIVNKLHWESGASPSTAAKKAVDQAIANLAEFVRAG